MSTVKIKYKINLTTYLIWSTEIFYSDPHIGQQLRGVHHFFQVLQHGLTIVTVVGLLAVPQQVSMPTVVAESNYFVI